MVLVRGLLAIIFGVIASIAPGAALTGVAIVFGAYALIDGVTTLTHAVQTRRSDKRWGWLLLQGVVSVLAGLVAWFFPGVAGVIGGLVVLWTIVVYAIMHGALGIASASGVASGPGRNWGVVSAILTLVFGILLAIVIVLTPGATLLGLIWTVGIYAIAFGIMLVVTAFQLRRGRQSAFA